MSKKSLNIRFKDINNRLLIVVNFCRCKTFFDTSEENVGILT